MYHGMREDDYRKLRDRISAAIWTQLDPLEERIETEESIPYDIVLPVLRECGAFGLLVPREYGGLGLSIAQYLPIIAEFAKIQGGLRVIVHVHNSFAHALSEIGSPDQCAAILPGTATGAKSLAFALTEPDNGTGADLSTTATATATGYVLNGRKWLITNSDLASHFMVFAKTDGPPSAGPISAFSSNAMHPASRLNECPRPWAAKAVNTASSPSRTSLCPLLHWSDILARDKTISSAP